MNRNKKKKSKSEETHLGWKMGSPDEVLAERNTRPVWSTQDGLAPTEERCKVSSCPEFSTRDPALCEEHFYGMTRSFRDWMVIKKNKKTEEARSSNGR